jgi:hypothetical protein
MFSCSLKGLNPGSSINLIYCTIIQIKFLIVSDVLQLQKIYSYNNFMMNFQSRRKR